MYIRTRNKAKNQPTEEQIIKKIERIYGKKEEFIEQYKKGNISKNAKRLAKYILDNMIDIDQNPNRENYRKLMDSITANKIAINEITIFSSKDLYKEMEEKLTEKEKAIIIERYGLMDGNANEMKQIAERRDISRERVRKIIDVAIRKLKPEKTQEKYKINLEQYKDTIGLTEEEKKEIEEIINLVYENEIIYKSKKIEKKDLKKLQKIYKKLKEKNEELEARKKQPPKGQIEELLLTPRTYNALKREGINTIERLSKTKIEELEAMPGIGEQAIKSIIARLKEYGITLPNEEKIKERKKETRKYYEKMKRQIPEGLKELETGHRVKKALAEHGIKNIKQITELTEENLLAIRDIGVKGAHDIQKALEIRGLKLKEVQYEIQKHKLTTQTQNTLLRNEIYNIEQLEQEDYQKIKGLGKKGQKEIQEAIEKHKQEKETKLETLKQEKAKLEQKQNQTQETEQKAKELLDECANLGKKGTRPEIAK